jgi:fatty-acyl-CoA synthase
MMDTYAGDWTPAATRLFTGRDAIICPPTEPGGEVRRLTYDALADAVDHMARVLVHLGIEQGDRVAVLAKNRCEHFALLYACARLGALYVPFNWRLAEPELAFLLDDTEASVLFFDDDFAYVAGKLCATRTTRSVALDGDLDDERAPIEERLQDLLELTRRHPSPPQARLTLDDAWIVLYTSGTTGRPKGALLPYRQVIFNALNTMVALDLTGADKTITYTPLFHTGALHVLSTPLLMCGGSFVLTEGFDPEQCLQICEDEGVTILFGVPTTFEMMSHSAAFARTDLSKVRAALCGGAPCPLSLIETWADKGVLFKQGYGLTEVGPNCLNLRVEDVRRKLGSAGRENLHIRSKILDEQGEAIEGPGKGELVLGGPCVCLGYWRRPDSTAAAFTDDGFFKTGDIVERDEEGFFRIVGRAKDMFISGGENVYPAEVERALGDFPTVRACAVVGVPDARWGEVGRAYVELSGPIDAGALRTFLKERLASYKVPKELCVLKELPRNASGKVVKHLLPRDADVQLMTQQDRAA